MTIQNCSNCRYKELIAGNSHISCGFPLMSSEEKIKISILSMSNINQYKDIVKLNFGFETSDHAIQNGWFSFPANFDPIWITGQCVKHSELIGETVDYQLKINIHITEYKQLLLDIQNKVKDEAKYKDILTAYTAAYQNVSLDSFGSGEDAKAKARLKLMENLDKVLNDKTIIDNQK